MKKNEIEKSMFIEIIGVIGIFPVMSIQCIYTIRNKRVFEIINTKLDKDSHLMYNSKYLDETKNPFDFLYFEIILKAAKKFVCSYEGAEKFENKRKKNIDNN